MIWLTSHWSRVLSSALALACYVSLYGPWVILAEEGLGLSLMGGYVRLALLLAVACVSTRLGHGTLARLSSVLRLRVTLLWGVVGVVLTFWGVALPLAAHLPYAWWLLLGLAAWVRGLYMGIYPPENPDMQRQMGLGTLGLALVMVLAHQYGLWEAVLVPATPFIVFWLVGILVTMGLMHLEELRDRTTEHTGALGRFWPPLLVGLASVMLALAVLFSWLAPALVRMVRPVAQFVWYGVRMVFGVVGYGLGYVVQLMIWILRWILSRGQPPDFEPPQGFEPGEMFPSDQIEGASPLIAETLKWMGMAALVLAAVAASAYVLLRVWQRQRQASPQELRESYASLSALRQWGSKRWHELLEDMERRRKRWHRFRRRVPASPLEMYHTLLALARQRGVQRPEASTPHEFLVPLKECFSGHEKTIEAISRAFIWEYYGDVSPSSVTMRELSRTWQEFRRQLNAEDQRKPPS